MDKSFIIDGKTVYFIHKDKIIHPDKSQMSQTAKPKPVIKKEPILVSFD